MSAPWGVPSSTMAFGTGFSVRASRTIDTTSPVVTGSRVAKTMPQTVAPIDRTPATRPTSAWKRVRVRAVRTRSGSPRLMSLATTRAPRPLHRGALDLVGELAERADRAGRDLPAARALVERHSFGALERRACLLEEPEQEVVLGARRGVLHSAQDLLVGDGRRPLGEGTLLHDVVDPPEEGVRRRLALREAVEGLHAPHELSVRGRERRRLARERVRLPVENGPEERRRLVVEIVAGRDDGHLVLERGAIHQVALGEPAARAGGPPRDVLDDRDRRAHGLRDPGDEQRHAAPRGERLAFRLRLHRVVEDAEVEVETGRAVALVDQDVPERERVLAARDRDEHVLVAREHAVLPDGLADLVPEEVDEVRRTEGGVVAPQLEDRGLTALPALHTAPPLMTGRSSIVSWSWTT